LGGDVTGNDVEDRVLGILAEALHRQPSEIGRNSSLIDDLGAESIDFIDIQYRLESAFGIEIGEDELWRGTLDLADPRTFDGKRLTDEAVAELRRRLPRFGWHRFPAGIGREDLPRLITVNTILDYLSSRSDLQG
jgi:acyl carrier protein